MEVDFDHADESAPIVKPTRRTLGALLGGGAIASAFSASGAEMETHQDPSGRAGTAVKTGCATTLSPAVQRGVIAAAKRAYRNGHPDNMVGSDFRNLGTTLAIAFSHFDEIGLTSAIEAAYRGGKIRALPEREYAALSERMAVAHQLENFEPTFRLMVKYYDEQHVTAAGCQLRQAYPGAVRDCNELADVMDRSRLRPTYYTAASSARMTLVSCDDLRNDLWAINGAVTAAALSGELAAFCALNPCTCMVAGSAWLAAWGVYIAACT